jgi:predicted CXXCH cytochrome family protein
MLKSCFTGKLFALVILAVLATSASADKNWRTNGNSKATQLEACVAPTDHMRRNHMDMIKHQRDVTVHPGIRKTDNSLHGCIDCHANKDSSGKFIPVNEEGQFCEGCHEYVSAQLDCFSCHATVPR